MASDFDAVKDVPGYKTIMKAILKSQIQHLVDQLSKETEEESVILTASMSDGLLCHLGSNSGKVFLDNHEDFKSQFLSFCLKQKHAKQQAKSAGENQTSMPSPTPVAVKQITTNSGRRIKPVSKEIQSTSTPRGRRFQPYTNRKPSKTPTSTITSPSSSISSPGGLIEIQPLSANEQSESVTSAPQKEKETATADLSTIKIEPIDSGFLALPDTIEGYRIVQNEAEKDGNDMNKPKTEEPQGGSEISEQTSLSESVSNTSSVQLASAGVQLPGAGSSNDQETKPPGVAELDTDMDISKPESDNNDESLDMSGLEQPGPSGMSTSNTSATEERNREEDNYIQGIDLADADLSLHDENITDSERESHVNLDANTGLMEEEVKSGFVRGDSELHYLVEHLRSTDVIKVMSTLASVLFTENELIHCSRTGKKTHKCVGDPRPPLDQMKLKKLKQVVMNKTQISVNVFNEKLANIQKMLRQKRKSKLQKVMGFIQSPN